MAETVMKKLDFTTKDEMIEILQNETKNCPNRLHPLTDTSFKTSPHKTLFVKYAAVYSNCMFIAYNWDCRYDKDENCIVMLVDDGDNCSYEDKVDNILGWGYIEDLDKLLSN